jgi:hypothetical protein
MSSSVPTALYHKVLRELVLVFGPAFRAAKNDSTKQTGAVALTIAHLFRKYKKLTDEERGKVVKAAIKESLGVDAFPDDWIDVDLFMSAMIMARDVSGDFACCRKLGLCGKPPTTEEAV